MRHRVISCGMRPQDTYRQYPVLGTNRQSLSIAQRMGDRTNATAGRTFRWVHGNAGGSASDTVLRYRNWSTTGTDWRDLLFLLTKPNECDKQFVEQERAIFAGVPR